MVVPLQVLPVNLGLTLAADYAERRVFPAIHYRRGRHYVSVDLARQMLADAEAQIARAARRDVPQGPLIKAYKSLARQLRERLAAAAVRCSP